MRIFFYTSPLTNCTLDVVPCSPPAAPYFVNNFDQFNRDDKGRPTHTHTHKDVIFSSSTEKLSARRKHTRRSVAHNFLFKSLHTARDCGYGYRHRV